MPSPPLPPQSFWLRLMLPEKTAAGIPAAETVADRKKPTDWPQK
jgi:hypothetical protein